MNEQNQTPTAEISEEEAASPNGTASMDGAAPAQEATHEEPTAETTAETMESDPVVLQAELEAAQARADEYYDQLQRVTADFQNARRRQEKQLADSIARASQRTIPQAAADLG